MDGPLISHTCIHLHLGGDNASECILEALIWFLKWSTKTSFARPSSPRFPCLPYELTSQYDLASSVLQVSISRGRRKANVSLALLSVDDLRVILVF
jgi:hypothetical protein